MPKNQEADIRGQALFQQQEQSFWYRTLLVGNQLGFGNRENELREVTHPAMIRERLRLGESMVLVTGDVTDEMVVGIEALDQHGLNIITIPRYGRKEPKQIRVRHPKILYGQRSVGDPVLVISETTLVKGQSSEEVVLSVRVRKGGFRNREVVSNEQKPV